MLFYCLQLSQFRQLFQMQLFLIHCKDKPAPNRLVQNRLLAGVPIIPDQIWTQIWIKSGKKNQFKHNPQPMIALLLPHSHVIWGGLHGVHAEKLLVFFVTQRANIGGMNLGNQMNVLLQSHLAAQHIDVSGFQFFIGQEQEQSEDEPDQDRSQQDLNNLPNYPENEGPPRLTQETRRREVNRGRNNQRSNSSYKKKKGRLWLQLRLQMAHADVCLEALTGGATTCDFSLKKAKRQNITNN
ncbi:MAG: hypothetical protein EZS28_001398 [Streblomastix strix]|uniref:Uncharacterized protein n=1 Tax=Streblomastix strix TaxID=222440 RepID=A0A5J4X8H1_9EUKA|nr:MAG: hypothetical protein EZS28_001398 [Streblomastix strix]